MKHIYGQLLYGVAKVIDVFFSLMISLFTIIKNFGDAVRNIILMIILMGCSISFMIPIIGIFYLSSIWFWIIVLLLMLPFLGSMSINYFKRLHYVYTNFMYDRADYYRLNKGSKRNLNYYKIRYQEELNRKFEEERRKAEEARRKYQEAENEKWRKIFEEYFGGYGSYQGTGSGYGSTSNPFSNFKSQYEKSCDVLGVAYNSSYSEIKSAYRSLAKRYHPDLSKEKNSEEMFKKINNAFDFLSEENVERYRKL